MGQRHQFFIKVLNPVKNDNLRLKDKDLKDAKKMFGNGKYTILAFHHQWLYGRSAVANILNVLHFTDAETLSTYGSPFGESFSTYGSPLEEYIKAVTQIISTQACSLHPRGLGIESNIFLNEEDPDMRHYFNQGDNNDGITIIDTITRKYCMMNIYDYDDDDDGVSIYSLPSLKPVSCRDYMKVYYPEIAKNIGSFYTEGKTDIEIQELVDKNIKDNIELENAVMKATKGILTEKELSKMFPKFYKELKIN